MSLKQECIDMINLIVRSLCNEDDNYYELGTNVTRKICQKTGEDITYTCCHGCECYDENCQHRIKVNVGVSFWDGGDCERNYVFENSPVKHKGIRYIKNRKQLMDEMFELKNELEEHKNLMADFGERYKEYLEYAKQFAEEVKKKYVFFKMVQTDILPMVFHIDYASYDKNDPDYSMTGNVRTMKNQNVINVFCCMRDKESTRRTIRHEVLHYMLYIAGLKHDDDSAIFHYLCKEYDANAYKKMSDEEQALYNQFANSMGLMKKVNEITKVIDETDLNNNFFVVMLLAIGANKKWNLYEELYKEACETGEHLLKKFNQKEIAG